MVNTDKFKFIPGIKPAFTMVELMVTTVVFSICIVSIASLFYTTQTIQRSNRLTNLATREAQSEIEVLRNNSYSSLTPGETIDFTSSLSSELPNSRQGTVVVSEPSSGLRRVDVTVSYADNGKTKDVTLSSMIGILGIAH